MRSKQDFDMELEEVRRVYGRLDMSYASIEHNMNAGDNNFAYRLLDSTKRLIEGLAEPACHPDLPFSGRVGDEEERRLVIIRENLSTVIDILSRYQTGSEQPKGPRFVAWSGRYALDDQGNYYAMTDGSVKEITLTSDRWNVGNVPVRISSELGIRSGLEDNIILEVVSGVPGRQYPVKVEHIDQDGDPFFVYEMDQGDMVMRLNPDRGKWKGTVEEDFVEFDKLPTDVQRALIGEEELERRSTLFRESFGPNGPNRELPI